MKPQSLRTRLIVIILSPLLLISISAAVWQSHNTTNRAGEIFDRGLLSAALAISRDVAITGGDALSPETRRLISDTSGGEVFYHVFAPDGVFVTGYATPPIPPAGTPAKLSEPLFYDADYKRRGVRVLRFQDVRTIDGISGLFSTTVWQNMEVRNRFIRDVVARAISVIALLLLSVGLIVWFGVGLGLRPLLDLQGAIARRTPGQLDPIRRRVPEEVQGIVATLNALLDRVSRRISSKDEFISNAAHQLRNPIAGVLALAEAVENAPSPKAAKARSAELVVAARSAAHLTNQLLSFERAKESDVARNGASLDFVELVRTVVDRFENETAGAPVSVTFRSKAPYCAIWGDEIMLQEAMLNLLTNAVVHGGPDVSQITLTLSCSANTAELAIADDGTGIDPADQILAISRFGQAKNGPGSGLGLPIAARAMENHGGRLEIRENLSGALVVMVLPLLASK